MLKYLECLGIYLVIAILWIGFANALYMPREILGLGILTVAIIIGLTLR